MERAELPSTRFWTRAEEFRFESPESIARRRRNRIIIGVVVVGAGVYYVTHLQRVPITNRLQYVATGESFEQSLAQGERDRILAKFKDRILPPTHKHSRSIERIGTSIIEHSNMPSLKKHKWQFIVIDEPSVLNAFALPGGIVVVFTGILPVMQNADGAATILGHEIAHVAARHSGEKLSRLQVLTVLSILVDVVFYLPGLRRLLTALMMELPFSRKLEFEADHIGLMLMARACYNPAEAANVWSRMEGASHHHDADHGIVRFLTKFMSTHPTHEERRARLLELQAEARREAAASHCNVGRSAD